MLAEGVDIIDIGGYSSRPGAYLTCIRRRGIEAFVAWDGYYT